MRLVMEFHLLLLGYKPSLVTPAAGAARAARCKY